MRVKIFGLKKGYNMANDIQVPLNGDRDWVMNHIRDEYPEYITGIDFSSDLLDDFHPVSKNTFAFMRTYLGSLKEDESKVKVIKTFVKKTRTHSRMYIEVY